MSHFDELYGQPKLTRRENWDGREEPVTSFTLTGRRGNILHLVAPDDAPVYKATLDELNELDWTTRKARHRPGQQPVVTIDIDHEVVD